MYSKRSNGSCMVPPRRVCASLDSAMQILVLSVAALVPLAITPGLLSHFDITPKIAILLFGVICLLRFGKKNVKNVQTLARSRMGRWFVAILAAQWISMAVSTAFSADPALSLNGSEWRRWGLL